MHRPGRRGVRVALAAIIIATLVGVFAAVAGIGFAGTSSLTQYQYGPTPGTNPPSISGTPQVGQTLTASPGDWNGDQPITYAYQWVRCDGSGNNCTAIAGENGQTYLVTSSDVGHTLRVTVTATNAAGTAQRSSNPVGPVTAGTGRATVSIDKVSLPNRLIIEQVKFTPNPVRGRQRRITIRVTVSDTRGFLVSGALVFVRSTPLLTTTPSEQLTGAGGVVTFKVFTRAGFPRKRANVQFFVRARKDGEPLLAGVSTRRLVQVLTR